MSVTILEALQNAEHNLVVNKGVGIAGIMGRDQLRNATKLLELGYDLYDEVEPLIEQHGSIDTVPEKPQPPTRSEEEDA